MENTLDTQAPMEQSDVVSLTAELVSAYVGNNVVAVPDLPGLIASVHGALTGLGRAGGPARPEKPVPSVPIKKSVTPRLSDQLGRRSQIQVLEAASVRTGAHTRGLQAKMGPAGGLSDGGSELRQAALGPGKGSWPRPAASEGARGGAGRSGSRKAARRTPEEGRLSHDCRPAPGAFREPRGVKGLAPNGADFSAERRRAIPDRMPAARASRDASRARLI